MQPQALREDQPSQPMDGPAEGLYLSQKVVDQQIVLSWPFWNWKQVKTLNMNAHNEITTKGRRRSGAESNIKESRVASLSPNANGTMIKTPNVTASHEIMTSGC